MGGSIGRGFGKLTDFGGRDRPGQFWPFAAVVIVFDCVAMTTVMVPTILDTIARMQRFAAEHPESATVESGPGQYSITIEGNHPELMPDMSLLSGAVAMLAAITALLLASAVVRRLHDRARSGLLGLLPLPFIGFACAMMPRIFASFGAGAPDLRLFFLLFPNNAMYLATLLFLVVQLASDGTRGPNRFGPDPRAGQS